MTAATSSLRTGPGARARSTAIRRLIVGNVTSGVTILLSGYVVVRGQMNDLEAGDIPLLLSILAGLLGLNAVDGLIERKVHLADTGDAIARLENAADVAHRSMTDLTTRVAGLQLSLDALQSNAAASQLLLERYEIPVERLRRARKILWSGVTLRASLRHQLRDLEVAIRHGADVTILLVDPASEALRAELAFREGVAEEFVDGIVQSAILNLQLLAESLSKSSFRLGFHRVFPTYGLLILDPDDDDGICYVHLYHPDQRGSSAFVVHAHQDARWFKLFVEQFTFWTQHARTATVRSPAGVERLSQPSRAPGGGADVTARDGST